MNQPINIEDYLEPTDPPLPFPELETFEGTNTLDSTVEVGETMITQGYRIPLQIKQGTTTKTVDFYIGSAPLTEGQSISKTSTGTEIELYQGENTISTTLGNKPEMKIDYLSTVVGVGERTAQLFDVSKLSGNNTHVISAGLSFDIANQTVTVNGTSTGRYPQVFIVSMSGTAIKLEVGETYYGFIVTENVPTNANVYLLVQAYYNSAYTTLKTLRTTKDSFTVPEGVINYRYLLVCEGNNISYSNTTVKFFISKTDTSKYSKFGYQIPIDIKQDDEVVDHKDIYIGTQPLIEGDYINQTGVYRRLH